MAKPREPVHIRDSQGRIRYPRLWRVGQLYEFDADLDTYRTVITDSTVRANGWTVGAGWYTQIPAGVST